METDTPNVIVLAGPNGAGKTTSSKRLLSGTLHVQEFANADEIARGLSVFNPEGAAFEAGRVMLRRLKELAAQRVTFAFETTLASKTFAPWLAELRSAGYRSHVLFFWLPSADMAIARVRDRVARGGHFVPDDTVRRRYERGLHNFFHLYQPATDFWRFFDNSKPGDAKIVAEGNDRIETVHNPSLWASINAGVKP